MAGFERKETGQDADRRIARLAILLLPLLIVAHAIFALVVRDPNAPELLMFEAVAPLTAASACGWRAMRSRGRARQGWVAVALAMLLWGAGIGSQLAGSLTETGASGTGAVSMLLFVLYGVPLAFLLASPAGDPWRARVVDGVLAAILGAMFSAYIFGFVPIAGADEAGGMTLAVMFDIQNIFITLFALARFRASSNERERRLFAALTTFAAAYMVVAGVYNHLIELSRFPELLSVAVGVPFLLLAGLALRRGVAVSVPPAGRMFERVVIAVCPLILPLSLLIISAAMLPRSPWLAVGGCIAATLGYGVRAVLIQLDVLDERDRMAELSQIDALTGLPNRRQFDEALRRELARGQRTGEGLALLMIDIDHFKLLNDALGHRVGDDRLCDVAIALKGCAARATDVVARYGGEEFAAILPGASAGQAAKVAEAMRAAVEALALASPAPGGRVTVSIGAARASEIDGDTGPALIERADAALYASKRGGRNRVSVAWPEGVALSA